MSLKWEIYIYILFIIIKTDFLFTLGARSIFINMVDAAG
jgi:hypothetical protein